LVTVTIAGEKYVIVDIGMRMLTPRELFAAQGFPADYHRPDARPARHEDGSGGALRQQRLPANRRGAGAREHGARDRARGGASEHDPNP
jgi:hypothetical protein